MHHAFRIYRGNGITQCFSDGTLLPHRFPTAMKAMNWAWQQPWAALRSVPWEVVAEWEHSQEDSAISFLPISAPESIRFPGLN